MQPLHEAIIQVLKEAGRPLHTDEITEALLASGLWHTSGKTPKNTVGAHIYKDLKSRGTLSPFVKTAPGTFGLRSLVADTATESTGGEEGALTFLEAAERVLKEIGDGRPMHYREITAEAIRRGWIVTKGKTPEATMYAQILTDIRKLQTNGSKPRFVKLGKGVVALAEERAPGVRSQIQDHNRGIEKELKKTLHAMDWADFEELTAQLLGEMGFEEIEMTPKRGDGGIDVRGTLVVAGTIRVRIAAQVKRWKRNIQAPIVQQVRGSLGAHEQGLIITTGGFSKGAREEARRQDAAPVALIDGEQLVSLLVQHELGVRRLPFDLLQLEGLSNE